jgi:hypothetical protein
VTRDEFNQKCKELCPHCEAIAVRLRIDTNEHVHDGAIAIPGTLGKRWSHTFCQANAFRHEWKDRLSE